MALRSTLPLAVTLFCRLQLDGFDFQLSAELGNLQALEHGIYRVRGAC